MVIAKIIYLLFHAETFHWAVSPAVGYKEMEEMGEKKGTPHFLARLREYRATSLFQGQEQIPAMFVGRRPIEEWSILASVLTVSHANWEAAGPNSIPVENWTLCPFWTTWPLVLNVIFRNSWTWALSMALHS